MLEVGRNCTSMAGLWQTIALCLFPCLAPFAICHPPNSLPLNSNRYYLCLGENLNSYWVEREVGERALLTQKPYKCWVRVKHKRGNSACPSAFVILTLILLKNETCSWVWWSAEKRPYGVRRRWRTWMFNWWNGTGESRGLSKSGDVALPVFESFPLSTFASDMNGFVLAKGRLSQSGATPLQPLKGF